MPRAKKKYRGNDNRQQPHDEDNQRIREDHGHIPPSQSQREVTQTNSRPELNPFSAGKKNQNSLQHQQEAQSLRSAALKDPSQAPRNPEADQDTHANSHKRVGNGKRRKIFDTRDTNTGYESSMRFPADDCQPNNKFPQQLQPPIAMSRRPHQSNDNRNGYHSTAVLHNQPRYNFEVPKYKAENQLDYGHEPYGYSVSVRPGNVGSNVRLQQKLNEGDYAQHYSYPPQSHYSDNPNANGNYSDGLKYPGNIMDRGPYQDYVGMSSQAEQVRAVLPLQMTETSIGSPLHDVDCRRYNPPFKGKVQMRKEEAVLNEITTIQSLEGDRFHEDNVCNQCGHFGHWLGDCVFPDDSGYIMGCPIHNAKEHIWDDCPDAKKMSLERKIMYLILRRRNKPAIWSTQPWIALVRAALQQGLEEYCWGPSVWTQVFVMKMIRGPKAGHPWLNFNYGRQLISTLPKDPETMGDPGVLVEKRLLWDQVHKPFPKTEEPSYGL